MKAVEQIGFMPGAGAPREVRNPALSGLRMWIIPGFRNYLIFYLTPEGKPDIIRVFHAAQDIQSLLEEEAEEQNGDA
jgi:plasmid stabilization system protein ParE